MQGWSSLPGGESGVLGSPYYANLLPQWLTNDTFEHMPRMNDIVRNTVERDHFVPTG